MIKTPIIITEAEVVGVMADTQTIRAEQMIIIELTEGFKLQERIIIRPLQEQEMLEQEIIM